MKSLLALLIGMMLMVPTPQPGEVARSIGHLIDHGAHCTAVSVGIGIWLSAAHCGNLAHLDGQDVWPLKVDAVADLKLLRGPVAPPLKVASREPTQGEAVTLWGWTDAYGEITSYSTPRPLPFFGHVQLVHVAVQLEDNGPVVERNLFHEGGGPGMSGGPIVNERGEVVGIIEALTVHPSVSMISPTVTQIRKFLGVK